MYYSTNPWALAGPTACYPPPMATNGLGQADSGSGKLLPTLLGLALGGLLVWWYFVRREEAGEGCDDWREAYEHQVDQSYVASQACRYQYRDGLSKDDAWDKAEADLEEEKRLNP